MRLGALLGDAGIAVPAGTDPAAEVTAVVQDSRAAGPGSLFVAIPGRRADGHHFAADALRRGAIAVIAERPLEGDWPVTLVADSRRALSTLAAAAAGHPSRRLCVAGITGTDGKTTTATMLWAAWRGAGIRASSITTVDVRCHDRVTPNSSRLTTMEAVEVHKGLGALGAAGCTHVALETSSHALELQRVADVDYRVAVYTRITSDHLELHGSRDRYLRAKARLLEAVGGRADGVAVLDRDDGFAMPTLAALPVARRLTYSAAGHPAADLVAEEVTSHPDGVGLLARTPWGRRRLQLRLGGRFNAVNALAALAAACTTGADLESAAAGLETLPGVSGRMERLDLGQPFGVVIDYAHTAEALATVLAELRPVTTGRLWAVFGSAGERDREKRPALGRAAAAGADHIVLTDEDPREEPSAAILAEIAAGIDSGGPAELTVIPDRAEAIRFALEGAAPGDTVLLAGKGHETSLIIGREARPWSERRIAERVLRGRLAGIDPPT